MANPIEIHVGDLVLLCTDGIVEATRQDGEFFGTDRLRESIREFGDLPLAELVARLGQRVRDFAGTVDPADDLTILALRRLK